MPPPRRDRRRMRQSSEGSRGPTRGRAETHALSHFGRIVVRLPPGRQRRSARSAPLRASWSSGPWPEAANARAHARRDRTSGTPRPTSSGDELHAATMGPFGRGHVRQMQENLDLSRIPCAPGDPRPHDGPGPMPQRCFGGTTRATPGRRDAPWAAGRSTISAPGSMNRRDLRGQRHSWPPARATRCSPGAPPVSLPRRPSGYAAGSRSRRSARSP